MEGIKKFKTDKYRSARGGNSRLLNLHCRKCKHVFAVYQKDGPGNLRRLYLDRILAPKNLVGLQEETLKSLSCLKCEQCGFVIGVPYLFVKEKRKAFRIFQDAIIKSRRKLDR